MKIKEAEFKDLPEIIAIQKLAFYEVAKFYNNYSLGPLQTTIKELEDTFNSCKYYVFKENKDIIASARVRILGNYCKIENVIVHPTFQNKGIGKSLITYIENLFSRFDYLELYTGKYTPKNINFYNNLGFKITDNVRAKENEPELVIMRKELTKEIRKS